ncbi:insulysin, putative [Cryptosporidium muris RN66]|uniref:Insulysin, putative n=1 Tax=Cryptosporidium muris (strain RN66) TaxID=441375 RepID=B6AJP5_CRYMR|nr:insulysin, putative [Cryptosporidium muris RN66]EEA08436.1 insulysin, putative [Cryptosporidium muris RN66]|eukprot:XP_002142785.1 insulysin [Cryptosporidium muris RN66]
MSFSVQFLHIIYLIYLLFANFNSCKSLKSEISKKLQAHSIIDKAYASEAFLASFSNKKKRWSRNLTNEDLIKEGASLESFSSLGKLSPDTEIDYFTAENGISILLISDKGSREAAFAYSIGCGFYQDPDNLPGLAHLMEHVTFLGSEQHPNATEWDEFLSTNGGIANAYTTSDLTVYYVLSPPRKLKLILDYFTTMLKSPIMDEKTVTAEINAVNQEHEKNIPNIIRLMLELALFQAPQNSPARKFGTGNFDTLFKNPKEKNINVTAALKELHNSCYTSDNISLVVKGPYNLSILKEIAEQAVNVIPSSKATAGIATVEGRTSSRSYSSTKIDNSVIKPSDFNNIGSSTVDSLGELEKIIHEEPVVSKLIKIKRGNSSPPLIMIYWPDESNSMTLMHESAEWQIFSFIKYYIENKGGNSLYTQLYNKGLAHKIEFFDHITTKYSIIGILITASDTNDETTQKIADLVTNYMDILSNKVKNEDNWLNSFYQNYTKMANIDFKYEETRNTAELVSQSAENLLMFPKEPEIAISAYHTPNKFLSKNNLSEIQKKVLISLVDTLTPNRASIIKLSDEDFSLKSSEEIKSFDPYDINYTLQDLHISPSSINELESMNIDEILSCVPKNLSIINLNETSCPSYQENGRTVNGTKILSVYEPCCIYKDEKLTIFWKGPIHKVPAIHLTFVQRLASSFINNNISGIIYAKIHAIVMDKRYQEVIAPFSACGATTITDFNRGRFITAIDAYSSNFENIIDGIKNSYPFGNKKPTEIEFNKALSNFKSQISSFSDVLAYEVGIDIASSIYLSNYYSKIELRDAVLKLNINYLDYLHHIDENFSEGYVDALIVGNIDSINSHEYVKSIYDHAIQKPISYEECVHDGVLDLPADIIVTAKNPISSDYNNAIVANFLTPPVDLLDTSIYSTIGELISVPFYDTVRTSWQDGYVAFAGVSIATPSMVLVGAVQSADRSLNTLECHIFDALKKIFHSLKKQFDSEQSLIDFHKRVKWFGPASQSVQKLETLSSYVAYFSKMIISHEICFYKGDLIETATDIFLKKPIFTSEKLGSLIEPSKNRRLVIVQLEGQSDDAISSTSILSNSLISDTNQRISSNQIAPPPTDEQCHDILNEQLSSVIKIKLEEKSQILNLNLNGKLRATRSQLNYSKNQNYSIYNDKFQCSVRINNAKDASGTSDKEIKSLMNIFMSKRFSSLHNIKENEYINSVQNILREKKSNNENLYIRCKDNYSNKHTYCGCKG